MGFTACSDAVEPEEQTQSPEIETTQKETVREMTVIPDDAISGVIDTEMPSISLGETAARISKFVDENGDIAVIPKDFMVSAKDGEHTVNTGVVVIGPDGSEFVWIPTTQTELAIRDFGSYVSWGANPSGYWDDTRIN